MSIIVNVPLISTLCCGCLGSVVEIFHDEESVFTGILFQDAKMRAAYSRLVATVTGSIPV